MTRAGDEMILELAGLLKTAAKDEDKPKDDKKEDKKCKCGKECKCEKECKCKKEDCACGPVHEKVSALTGILQNLVKIANTLDEAGADEAANLVDDVIQVILKDKKAMEMPYEGDLADFDMGEEVFEDEPAPVDVEVPPEEDMPEVGSSGDDPADKLVIDPGMAEALIDMGWEPPPGYKV